MAQIINVTPQPQQNNQQQDDFSQTAPARAGTAAVAPPVQGPLAPGQVQNLPAFSMEPNQPVDPAFDQKSAATIADPYASPFSKYLAGRSQEQNMPGAGAGRGDPLAQAPGAIDRLVNFFSRQDPNKPNMDARSAAAEFYGRPEVQNIVHGNKALYDAAVADPVGMHAKLEPLINAAQNAPIASANGKPVNDPAGLAAHVQRTGMHENVVAPFHEPHNYTEEEFVNATRGINWEQLQQLQGLQHYLTPQQQSFGSLLEDQGHQANVAQAAYEAAVKAGLPSNKVEEARKARDAAAAEITKTKRMGAFPGTALPEFNLPPG